MSKDLCIVLLTKCSLCTASDVFFYVLSEIEDLLGRLCNNFSVSNQQLKEVKTIGLENMAYDDRNKFFINHTIEITTQIKLGNRSQQI